MLRQLVSADPPQHLQAVDPRKLQIEEHDLRLEARVATEVRTGPMQVVEGLYPVVSNDHMIRDVVLPERSKRELLVVRIVLHEEDRSLHSHGLSSTARSGSVK